MKKNILISVLFLPILFLFLTPKVIKAAQPAQCAYCSCGILACSQDQNCDGCNCCQTVTAPPAPDDQSEDITGKVYNPVLPPNLSKTTGVAFLQKIIKTGITALLVAGSVLFFFILASGGIKWLSSSGDKVKLESAQKQITSGLTGLAILLSSFAIIKLVETLFGIDLLNITLPTL